MLKNLNKHQEATLKRRKELEKELVTIRRARERSKARYDAQEKIVDQKLDTLRGLCQHIDNGGFLVAGCDICGWMDTYGAG